MSDSPSLNAASSVSSSELNSQPVSHPLPPIQEKAQEATSPKQSHLRQWLAHFKKSDLGQKLEDLRASFQKSNQEAQENAPAPSRTRSFSLQEGVKNTREKIRNTTERVRRFSTTILQSHRQNESGFESEGIHSPLRQRDEDFLSPPSPSFSSNASSSSFNSITKKLEQREKGEKLSDADFESLISDYHALTQKTESNQIKLLERQTTHLPTKGMQQLKDEVDQGFALLKQVEQLFISSGRDVKLLANKAPLSLSDFKILKRISQDKEMPKELPKELVAKHSEKILISLENSVEALKTANSHKRRSKLEYGQNSFELTSTSFLPNFVNKRFSASEESTRQSLKEMIHLLKLCPKNSPKEKERIFNLASQLLDPSDQLKWSRSLLKKERQLEHSLKQLLIKTASAKNIISSAPDLAITQALKETKTILAAMEKYPLKEGKSLKPLLNKILSPSTEEKSADGMSVKAVKIEDSKEREDFLKNCAYSLFHYSLGKEFIDMKGEKGAKAQPLFLVHLFHSLTQTSTLNDSEDQLDNALIFARDFILADTKRELIGQPLVKEAISTFLKNAQKKKEGNPLILELLKQLKSEPNQPNQPNQPGQPNQITPPICLPENACKSWDPSSEQFVDELQALAEMAFLSEPLSDLSPSTGRDLQSTQLTNAVGTLLQMYLLTGKTSLPDAAQCQTDLSKDAIGEGIQDRAKNLQAAAKRFAVVLDIAEKLLEKGNTFTAQQLCATLTAAPIRRLKLNEQLSPKAQERFAKLDALFNESPESSTKLEELTTKIGNQIPRLPNILRAMDRFEGNIPAFVEVKTVEGTTISTNHLDSYKFINIGRIVEKVASYQQRLSESRSSEPPLLQTNLYYEVERSQKVLAELKQQTQSYSNDLVEYQRQTQIAPNAALKEPVKVKSMDDFLFNLSLIVKPREPAH